MKMLKEPQTAWTADPRHSHGFWNMTVPFWSNGFWTTREKSRAAGSIGRRPHRQSNENCMWSRRGWAKKKL